MISFRLPHSRQSNKYPFHMIFKSFPTQSLFSTTAFGLGAKYFAFYEIQGMGVQWNNIAKSPVEDDQYNLLYVLCMMVVDTVLYSMLTWYIENVHPGKFIILIFFFIYYFIYFFLGGKGGAVRFLEREG